MAKATAEVDTNKSSLFETEFWTSQSPLALVVTELMRPAPANWYEASVRIALYLAVGAAVVSYNQTRGRVKSSKNEAKVAIENAKGA